MSPLGLLAGGALLLCFRPPLLHIIRLVPFYEVRITVSFGQLKVCQFHLVKNCNRILQNLNLSLYQLWWRYLATYLWLNFVNLVPAGF